MCGTFFSEAKMCAALFAHFFIYALHIFSLGLACFELSPGQERVHCDETVDVFGQSHTAARGSTAVAANIRQLLFNVYVIQCYVTFQTTYACTTHTNPWRRP